MQTMNLFKTLFRGWSGDAMVLGKLPVPGRPTIWITKYLRNLGRTKGEGWSTEN